MNKCSGCGVERVSKPKIGTCPCCFGELERHGKIYFTCRNEKCNNTYTEEFLKGFWHGWQERERS